MRLVADAKLGHGPDEWIGDSVMPIELSAHTEPGARLVAIADPKGAYRIEKGEKF